MQYKIFFSSLSKCQEVFQNEVLTSRIHSLCFLMILSWYFFKSIESLHFCKMISWWVYFIVIDTIEMMRRSFKFFMRTQVKAWIKAERLFFVVSTTCRVSISDWIAANFCFFRSSSHWSIIQVSCSLISRENSFSASSLSNFIMQRSFSDIVSCKIETSSLQLCCDCVAVVMLEYWIIIFKKSLK